MAGGESEMIPRAVRPRDPARTEKAAAVSRSTRCFVGSASPSSTSLKVLTVRMLQTRCWPVWSWGRKYLRPDRLTCGAAFYLTDPPLSKSSSVS